MKWKKNKGTKEQKANKETGSFRVPNIFILLFIL